MVTPRTAARAYTNAATISLACAITAISWHPLYALPGLAGAILLRHAGRSYQRLHETAQAAEILARPFPNPAPIPAADPEWDAVIRAYYQPSYDPRSST